jgi:hypothetical protein
VALERRNPLPAGRYWVDIQTKFLAGFQNMLDRNASTLTVESREEHPLLSNFDLSVTTFVFRTSAPLEWKSREWGYPTKAGPDIQSAADTSQRPAPEPSGLDQLSSMLDDVKTGAIALVVLYFLFSGNKGRSQW